MSLRIWRLLGMWGFSGGRDGVAFDDCIAFGDVAVFGRCGAFYTEKSLCIKLASKVFDNA